MQTRLPRRFHNAITAVVDDEGTRVGLLPSILTARFAAGLFLLGGLLGGVANILLDKTRTLGMALAAATLVIGAMAWFVPWKRFPRAATVWPVPVAIAFLLVARLTGNGDDYSYGGFYTLVFAWIGITQSRGTSLVLAIPAGAAFALPLMAEGRTDYLVATLTFLPICVLVGESLAWLTARLIRTEDQLRTTMALQGDFLAMTSHELRTPLTTMIGFSTLMRQRWSELTDEEKLEFLGRIERNGHSLTSMVENLVVMAGTEAGAIAPNETLVNVADLIHLCIDPVVAAFGPVTVSCPPDIKTTADPELLGIIVHNLVLNACRYGQPPINIEVTKDDHQILIAVVDHGDGIAPGEISRMFEKFSQASTGTTRTAQGLGLGLSIARSLARLQRGDVTYTPNIPRGSRFVVSLPEPVMSGGVSITPAAALSKPICKSPAH